MGYRVLAHIPILIQYLLPGSDQNGQNLYPFSDQNSSKTIPFGAAHTCPYIVHIREYYFPPAPRAHRLLHETGLLSSCSSPFLVARCFRSRLKESREKMSEILSPSEPHQKMWAVL